MSTSTLPHIQVNVRLCGSIPRVDLSSQYTEDDCVVQKLCSHLYTMQHQQQQQEEQAQHKLIQPQHIFYNKEGISPPSSRRQSPTYEAPSWAVPASGEARLEVSMGNFLFYNIFSMLVITLRFELRTRSLTIIALL